MALGYESLELKEKEKNIMVIIYIVFNEMGNVCINFFGWVNMILSKFLGVYMKFPHKKIDTELFLYLTTPIAK